MQRSDVSSQMEKLFNAIVGGVPDRAQIRYLDGLLIWLSGGKSDLTNSIETELDRRGLDATLAKQLTLVWLDWHLFASSASPHAVMGLPDNADIDAVRKRYRRLIAAFHPDRDRTRTEWLTRRTEQINVAYAEIKNGGEAAAPAPKTAPPVTATAPPLRSGVGGVVDDDTGERVRAVLGSPKTFERRFFVGLVLLCGGFLVYLAAANLTDGPPPQLGRLSSSGQSRNAVAPVNADTAAGGDVAGVPQSRSDDRAVVSAVSDAVTESYHADILPGTLSEMKLVLAADASASERRDAVAGVADHQNADRQGRVETAAVTPSTGQSKPLAVDRLKSGSAGPGKGDRAAESPTLITPDPAPEPENGRAKLTADNAGKSARPATPASQRITVSDRPDRPSGGVAGLADAPADAPKPRHMVALARQPETAPDGLEPPPLDCQLGRQLVQQFVGRYRQGDLKQLMALYRSGARENQTRGEPAIRRLYVDFFRATSQRRMTVTIELIERLSDGRCRIGGRYAVGYRRLDGGLAPASGKIAFTLQQTRQRFGIDELDY